jgi:predicted RNA-binding Zn ribbon-like protein
MADLPEVLDLPLAGGAAYWYWLGGRPATDFVNTLRERWRRRVETLATPADLGLWLHRAGLLDEPPGAVPASLLPEARAVREAIDACLTAALDGRTADASALARIDRWLPAAAAPPRLIAGPALVAAARDDPRRALGVVALDAAHMLGDPAEATRMRICASATCSARFYDRSPTGRRRWCSMQGCGNQAKARRYRARHHHERESI